MSLTHMFKALIGFFWSKDWKIRLYIILSIFFGLVTVILNVSVPIVLRYVLNFLNDAYHQPELTVILTVASYGIIWSCAQLSLALRSIFLFRPLYRTESLMVINLFKHVLTLPLSFHLDRKTGSLISNIGLGRNALNNIINSLLWQIIPLALEAISAVVVICYMYGLVYAAIIFVALSLYLFTTLFTSKKSMYYQSISNENYMETNAFFHDAILNYETIKYFNNDDLAIEQCNETLAKCETGLAQSDERMHFISMLNMLIVGISITIVTCYAGVSIAKHQLTVGDFVLLTGYLLQFSVPMTYFGYVFQMLKRAVSHIKQLIEVFEVKPEVNEAINTSIKANVVDIQFKYVKFSYDGQREILKDISFEVPNGKTLAIVGPTGSGKSTIARLLFRFYNVDSGNISINNQDIKSVSLDSLRSIIGVVPQDTILFNNSIKYNVGYGNRHASDEELLAAVDLAGLSSLIKKLPLGLETIVGERGLKLSGGEKQRVAIARMLLKKPKIYIFDEATSSLDVETERLIQKNIETISENVTTIIIAHRLSTVMHADMIIVLDHGIIVEKGTHSDLLDKKGLYAKMWEAQSRHFEDLI